MGCAMLVGTMFILILTTIVLKVAKAGGLTLLATIASKVPYFLAGVFMLFLLMQGLRYLIPRADDERDEKNGVRDKGLRQDGR